MARRFISQMAILLWIGLSATLLWGWGLEAHRVVNGYALDLTPGPLGEFLRKNRETIVALAGDADERRETDPSEGPKHYIDLEYYGGPPHFSIPFDRAQAEAMYSPENMVTWGTLPWHLVEATLALRDAMAWGDWERVPALAADVGHYLADAHQPLHTTANYNGQLTGNDGVHSMFEVFMVNRYLPHFDRPIPPIPVIEGLQDSIFMWMVESFQEVDGILAGDSWARKDLSSKERRLISQGYDVDPQAIPAPYLERLFVQSGLVAWQRLSKATVRLTALWLWAWEDAGKPLPHE